MVLTGEVTCSNPGFALSVVPASCVWCRIMYLREFFGKDSHCIYSKTPYVQCVFNVLLQADQKLKNWC